MIEQDVTHIDLGLKTLRDRRRIVKTSYIHGQQLYRISTKDERRL